MDAQRRDADQEPAEVQGVVTSLSRLPLMLTVSEAATVLRISRASAYKLINEHRASRGAAGLEHVRLGSRIMVRRVDLARLVGVDEPR